MLNEDVIFEQLITAGMWRIPNLKPGLDLQRDFWRLAIQRPREASLSTTKTSNEILRQSGGLDSDNQAPIKSRKNMGGTTAQECQEGTRAQKSLGLEVALPTYDIAYNYNLMREKLFFRIKPERKQQLIKN